MSIVTVQDYRDITRDLSQVDGDVERALLNAQDSAERYCERQFDLAEVTERLAITSRGRVYPSRYPVTEVSTPTTATVSPKGSAIFLTGSGDGWYDTNALLNYPDGYISEKPSQDVTYTGGFTSDTAPYDLKAVLCEMAQRALNPAVLVGVPAGATNISSGASSVSGNRLGGFSYMAPDIKVSLNEFKNRRL